MYDFSKINENYSDNELKSHQHYFILRWGELLEDSPLHFRKLLKPCSRSLLNELLDVFNLYKSGVLHVYNINLIIKEVIKTLKNDIILKKYLPDDYHFIISKLSEFIKNMFETTDDTTEEKEHINLTDKNINYINSLSKSFSNKLESLDVVKIYSDHFKTTLSEETYNYSLVDRDIELFISELIYEGHSKSYLYRWGEAVFIHEKSKTNFLNRIELIKEQLGIKKQRDFKCFLKVNLPSKNNFLYGLTGHIRFLKSANDAKTLLEEETNSHLKTDINQYFQEDQNLKIGIVTLKATDLDAALHKAHTLLTSRLSLFNLDKQSKVYNPSIKKEIIIYDVKENSVFLKNYSDEYGIKITKTSEYLNILFSTKEEEYQPLHRLMEWLRIVQDSPRETGLVAIWSMLELLFVHDYTDKRKSVSSYTIPYISHFYAKSIITRSMMILENSDDKYKELKAKLFDFYGEQAFTKTKKIKKDYFVEYIKLNQQEVLEIYSNHILHQRYILLINSLTSIKKGPKKQKHIFLKEFIDELEEKINNDLQRGYRTRNILAHEAAVNISFFVDIYEQLIFYMQIVLDDIFYSISKQNKNTIEQLVTIKRESYLLYIKFITELHKDFEKEEPHREKYKKILNTRNLFI